MKSVLASLFVCALVFVANGYPNGGRLRRQATSEPEVSSTSSAAESSSSSSSTTAEPVSSISTSSTTTPPPEENNEFGFGAAAGIGGLRRGIGVGSFDPNIKTDAFSPWGAFAGINLGNGGRIGAGCSGLNCGVQLGHLVLGTPHLLGIGKNLGLRQPNGIVAEGKKGIELAEAETNLQNGADNTNTDDPFRNIFRDAFRGFRETLQSFFRAPVTHFIKKHVHIDNSTESVVGAVKPAASEQQTYRIQLTPARPAAAVNEDKDANKNQNQQENELD